jgi:hypothetical protein
MSYEDAIRQFLDEQPQWLERDVQYRLLPDRDEPEICLSTQAMTTFIRWAHDHGFVGKPEKVPGMLVFIESFPELYRSHESGICNPETCPLCRQEDA